MKKEPVLWSAIKAIIFFTVLLGIIYPLIVTLIGQLFFPYQANGSLIKNRSVIIGSKLIAQNFAGEIYFHPRPSAINYNPFPSGASNLSLTDSRLKTKYEIQIEHFIKQNNLSQSQFIPAEMLFASASGVDPHISKMSALLQFNRIASKRNLNEIRKVKLRKVIDSLSIKSVMGIFGDEFVNVLELNLKLDELSK